MSWVRHRDVHILTAGEQTFTSDQRFSSKHNTEDQWVLLIKYVQVGCQSSVWSHNCHDTQPLLQERDAGIYECQIPTQPPQSYPITLNIIGNDQHISLLVFYSPTLLSSSCGHSWISRPSRQQRLHHQPHLCHLSHSRASSLHLLVFQRQRHGLRLPKVMLVEICCLLSVLFPN